MDLESGRTRIPTSHNISAMFATIGVACILISITFLFPLVLFAILCPVLGFRYEMFCVALIIAVVLFIVSFLCGVSLSGLSCFIVL